MKLPVMKTDPSPPTADVLWGRYVDIRHDYEMAASEPPSLEVPFGRGVCRKSHPGLLLLSETAAEDFIGATHQAFEKANCRQPIVIEPATANNRRFLENAGYLPMTGRLLRLQAAPPAALLAEGLLVLSGRAALPALERVSRQSVAHAAAIAEVLTHLDDPQFECIVALKDGQIAGRIGLQIRGQSGLLIDWDVQSSTEIQSLKALLLHRALELATRSQLVDVFAEVGESETEKLEILTQAGFGTVGEFKQWRLPVF